MPKVVAAACTPTPCPGPHSSMAWSRKAPQTRAQETLRAAQVEVDLPAKACRRPMCWSMLGLGSALVSAVEQWRCST
jgi:hypothetical protein